MGVECTVLLGPGSAGALRHGGHADPLGGVQQHILGRLDGVFHEHGHRHWADPPWHRGDEAGLLSNT